ncbi:hypothetical protein GCM10023322_30380 [Rugosimonospora acidiphila]|uniref:Uncharacterized protein n=1 Tax=Rugosimonospora acidiphila TaxID=556531 RepID=A0ABP9RSV1_9ACTN
MRSALRPLTPDDLRAPSHAVPEVSGNRSLVMLIGVDLPPPFAPTDAISRLAGNSNPHSRNPRTPRYRFLTGDTRRAAHGPESGRGRRWVADGGGSRTAVARRRSRRPGVVPGEDQAAA